MPSTPRSSRGVRLWIEVGPGQVLGSLVSGFIDTPVVSLDAGGPSLKGLWGAVAAAFVMGGAVNYQALSAGRFTRPLTVPLASALLH